MTDALCTFLQASAHQLTGIADGTVQAIVTSPPYYGLRAYAGEQAIEWPAVEYAPMPGLPPIRIAGCEPGCEHEWQDGPVRAISPHRDHSPDGGFGSTRGTEASRQGMAQTIKTGAYCAKCGGWRGGLGNEPTLEAYIGHLVLCLREWRRVLRDDGIAFVNLGDTYAANRPGGQPAPTNTGNRAGYLSSDKQGVIVVPAGLKPKDLMMVPARFALAAQADGWWLRADIIGHKIAPMPESVTDRPTRSHEHIFMLTKASRYFWDAEAVKETAVKGAAGSTFTNGKTGVNGMGRVSQLPRVDDSSSRNMRDVIEWRPSPFPGAHFAVWPEAIPEKLIRAATSERGCCSACGAPWVRVVEKTPMPRDATAQRGNSQWALGAAIRNDTDLTRSGQEFNRWKAEHPDRDLGFAPSCACPQHEPTPCLVLDPFSGSGTTAKVAVRLGRRAIGVDICDTYINEVTALRFGQGVQMELVSA